MVFKWKDVGATFSLEICKPGDINLEAANEHVCHRLSVLVDSKVAIDPRCRSSSVMLSVGFLPA